MARSHFRHVVQDRVGNAIQNALVNVYTVGTTTPVSDLYLASSGGSPVTTLTTNSSGEAEGWLVAPKSVDLNVTDNSNSAYYPSAPANLLDFAAFTELIEVLPNPSDVFTTASGEALSTVAASGTAQTLDVTAAGTYHITLTGNCTFTLTAPPSGKAYGLTVILKQDGTGSRTVTWPASVKWPSAVAPTLSTGASKVDVVSLVTVDAGTTWFAFLGGLDLR